MGGLVALPLVVGTAFVGWRDRRRLALLALAGVSSLASFLVLNPYARYYLPWVAHLQRDYAMRAEQKGMTRGSMPRELVEYLSGPYVHGHVFAALAALGLVWLTVGLFRRAGPGEDDLSASRRAQRAMLVVFPPLYAGAYLLSTPHFKGNNVLPIVPFTTLAGLWLVWEIARRARARLPALGRPAVLAAGAAALVVWLGSPGTLYVYRTLLPSTSDRALAVVARGPGPEFGKTIVIEEAA